MYNPDRNGHICCLLVVGGSGSTADDLNGPLPIYWAEERSNGELDAAFKVNDQTALNRFSSFIPRVVVGVGGNVEVGLNVTGNIQPGADSTTLVPTGKWRFYQNEKSGIALIAGTDLFIPVRNRTYHLGTYSYVAISKTHQQNPPDRRRICRQQKRLAPDAVRGGGQFGIEQTVSSKFSVAADWITANMRRLLHPRFYIQADVEANNLLAYSIGNINASNGNHFFLFEAGYNFN
jgi:hypothetical protein